MGESDYIADLVDDLTSKITRFCWGQFSPSQADCDGVSQIIRGHLSQLWDSTKYLEQVPQITETIFNMIVRRANGPHPIRLDRDGNTTDTAPPMVPQKFVNDFLRDWATPILAERDTLKAALDSSQKNVLELKGYLANAKKRIVEIADDNARLRDALHAFLRAPSVGSDGPGSVTLVVQTYNLDVARDALAVKGKVG